MNSFDLAVYAALAVAVGFGFRTGLLRSAMTILAYLLAAPIAVALMPMIAPQIAGNANSPLLQNWIWFFAIFVVVGMLFGHIGRIVLNDTVGEAGIGDRLGGAALGAIRVGLVATTLMLAFASVHYNLRLLTKWAAKNDRYDADPELLGFDRSVVGYELVTLDDINQRGSPQATAA